MSNQRLSLASEFEPATDAMWRLLVEKTLKGKSLEKAMTSHTYDGIAINALYTKEGHKKLPRPNITSKGWEIIVPHWNPDPRETNAAILQDLERGAEGLALRLQAGAFPGVSVVDLEAVLEDVYLNMAALTLVPGEEYEAGAEAVLALLADREYDAADIKGTLGIDPISTLAQTGRLKEPVGHAVKVGAEIAAGVAEKYPGLATFMADGGLYHMSGATEAQELGLMVATGVAYLRAMEEQGIGLDRASQQIQFSLSADADILLTIAKFRAARILWDNVLKACGVASPTKMVLNGVSSLRMISVKDPWVNILRATAACFGAGVGGADSVCILPHDTMLGMSSDFARRIARNTQIILQEESGLAHVMDPAAGSFSFESITSELAYKAWKYFQKMESSNGLIVALKQGQVQADLRESWAARSVNIATRKDAVTGVSEFPFINETPINDIGPMPAVIQDLAGSGDNVEPVEFHRLGEDYETLRAYSDACLEKNNGRPSVYIANIGTPANYSGRSNFSKNFFEAGGIQAVVGKGGLSEAEITAEFRESGARIAVLSSADDIYAATGKNIAESLKEAGALYLYLAGNPSDQTIYMEAGIDEFIYMGCDVLQTLAHAHTVVGEGS